MFPLPELENGKSEIRSQIQGTEPQQWSMSADKFGEIELFKIGQRIGELGLRRHSGKSPEYGTQGVGRGYTRFPGSTREVLT